MENSLLVPVNPSEAAPSFSQGMILKGSGVFVSSGHVGTDEKGKMVVSSFEDQVVAVFESIGRTLSAGGLGFEHVARVKYYITDFEPMLMDIVRKVRSRYLRAEIPPASVLIGISALPDPGARIEVEVIAVVP
ncbi:RidA family protein [Mesorhizobium sp. M0983]|uniref:RidA family protein n=1 Tax=Mesorhizobium sp. M0983 TaxID=2957040 RepID=UPI00333ADBC8